MTATKRERRPRRPTSPLEGLAVGLTDDELVAHASWLERRRRLEEPATRVLRFASWYPPAVRRWVEQATAAGLWGADDAWGQSHEGCRRRDEALGHHTDGEGLRVHLVVDEVEGAGQLVARYCGRGVPPFPPARFTDDQRLTFEELVAGQPCKGCGRGFSGGPERKPTMQLTAGERAALDAEEETFLRLHPDCGSMRWTIGGGGVTHCSVCCPPPPFGPEQSRRIATILAEMVRSAASRDAELARRWAEAGRPAETA